MITTWVLESIEDEQVFENFFLSLYSIFYACACIYV